MHESYAALAIIWQYLVCMFVWFRVEIGLGQYVYSLIQVKWVKYISWVTVSNEGNHIIQFILMNVLIIMHGQLITSLSQLYYWTGVDERTIIESVKLFILSNANTKKGTT